MTADDEHLDEDVVTRAAAELLKAAIVLRDLVGAMPMSVRAGTPPDIMRRCAAYSYQGAFDALPARIREAATALALADPDVQEARRIDAEGRGEQ